MGLCGCGNNSSILPSGGTGAVGPAGPPGNFEITDITWAALDALATAGTMVEGMYRITDFRTYYRIPNTVTYYTGVDEPLIVFATSSTTLDKVAYSALHPNDIIHYSLVAPSAIKGDRGVIDMRHDTQFNIKMPYDFRNVKYRRWESSVGSGIFNQLTDPGGGEAYQDEFSLDVLNSENFIWESVPEILSNNLFGEGYNTNIFSWQVNNNTISYIYDSNIDSEVFNSNYVSGGVNGCDILSSNFNANIIPGLSYCNFKCNSFQNNIFSDIIDSNNFILGSGSITGVDFSASTHVYNSYSCEVFLNASSVEKLSYYNAADALTVVLPTA